MIYVLWALMCSTPNASNCVWWPMQEYSSQAECQTAQSNNQAPLLYGQTECLPKGQQPPPPEN